MFLIDLLESKRLLIALEREKALNASLGSQIKARGNPFDIST